MTGMEGVLAYAGVLGASLVNVSAGAVRAAVQMVVLPVAAMLVMAVAIVGLFARGRWRLSVLFVGYVVSILVTEVLVTGWRRTFWTTEFWVPRQAIFDILKIGIALEVGWRTFRLFPGAGSAVRWVVLAILTITIVSMLMVSTPPGPTGWATAHLARLHPPMLIGTIWLMAAILLFARWYRVPIHPFHGAILSSLAAYMALFSGLLTVMGWYGLDAIRSAWGLVDPPAFFVMTIWWAYIAWRPNGNAATAHDGLLARLRIGPSTL